MTRPLVALLTDFGRADSYVAEMHRAVLHTVPSAQVLDVSHDLTPYDLDGAALVAERVVGELPEGAALVVVCDPGVGTARARIAASHQGRWLVGPDNGTLPVTADDRVHRIECRMPREGVTTFDGREVFAPTAALLAAGLDLRLVGPRVRLTVPSRVPADATFERVGPHRYARGVVIGRDRYGNAVTNIRVPADVDRATAEVLEPESFAGPLRTNYGAVPIGARVALVGSSGRLELSVHRGATALVAGEEVVLRCDA